MSEETYNNPSRSLSALQENIENKGKNAYYFAHTNTPTGPKWDGKPQPRLLAKHSCVGASDDVLTDANDEAHISNEDAQSLLSSLMQNKSSFDYSQSNISKYAFVDEGKKVKIYIDLKGIGERNTEENDITLDWTETSFRFVVRNYKGEVGKNERESEMKCLAFGRLQGPIKNASFKKKKASDRIIITLWKSEEEDKVPVEWTSIGGARSDD